MCLVKNSPIDMEFRCAAPCMKIDEESPVICTCGADELVSSATCFADVREFRMAIRARYPRYGSSLRIGGMIGTRVATKLRTLSIIPANKAENRYRWNEPAGNCGCGPRTAVACNAITSRLCTWTEGRCSAPIS